MIGREISHYKILDQIGQGGMGVIYKAQDTKLNRLVALKFLPQSLTRSSEEKNRFIQEAIAASALNHPNIVTIYEIDEVDGDSFISMEFIEGKNLKGLIQAGPLSLEQFFNIAFQTAEGLNKAHQKGIVHRDIKSENILVNSDGVAKITDFGVAKLKGAAGLTLAGTVLGTTAYMSPEQANGEEVDQRSDIFSLGIIFYEILTGQLPFQGMHPMAVMYAIINEEPLSPRSLRDEIPVGLENIISQTLAKNKEDRYQSLTLLLDDLRTLTTGGKIEIKKADEKAELKSIAVLPFGDLSPDKENQYFSNGITEDIITDLSQITQLRVTPRSVVANYQDSKKDLKQIGKELKVDFILEGSVRKHGEKIRVTAQLTNVADGFHLWAEKFDGELKDIFEIQETVSKKIVDVLKLKLTKTEIQEIAKKPTVNPLAYDFYLKGQEYNYKEGKTNIDFAMRMYEKALEVDSNYPLAYAGLADSYVNKYMAYYDRSTAWLEEAERACKRALNLDSDLAEAHRALGRVYMFKKRPQDAIAEFKKAIELKPDYFEAYRSLGWINEELGNFEETIGYAKKAIEIKPLDKESHLLLGLTYFDMNNFSEALKMFDQALEIAPDYYRAYYSKGNVFQREGKFPLAIQNYRKALEFGMEPNLYLDSGWVYLVEKEYDSAIECFKKLIELGFFDFLAYYYLGLAYQLKEEKWMAAASYDSAAVLCVRKINEDSNNPYLHATLGLAYTALRKPEEGLKMAVRALKIEPDNGAILYDVARVYALQEKNKEAIETLTKAIKKPLSPSFEEAKLDPHFEKIVGLPEFTKIQNK